jgi:hypothetical protein
LEVVLASTSPRKEPPSLGVGAQVDFSNEGHHFLGTSTVVSKGFLRKDEKTCGKNRGKPEEKEEHLWVSKINYSQSEGRQELFER